ncbi:beta-galactosidase [Galendromus occidentalis]|uniref:Beta-galactosidase n=1 Tax=Galendromus occidentalis TaxID=34638 RepID=A0AAJ6VYS3_9ACAR|nr:beta-galactosidase [Galendromus occidentalis]
MWLVIAVFVCSAAARAPEFVVDYDNNCFSRDGKPFQMISGSLHYFNVPEQLWEDRLLAMRNCGVNTVQTYVEWRTLEPRNNVFDFTGRNNITRFIKIAQKVGLLVNLRPGPYICSEREMGGLPWWLMQVNPRMKIRTNDAEYMSFVERYWRKLLPLLRPLLYSRGGPIILVQIENEYGSYSACDFSYTAALRDLAMSLLGENVVYYSTDGDRDGDLKCGKNEGVFTTVDFGVTSDVKSSFAAQRRHQMKGPLVNSEYYTGWLDHWGGIHETVPTAAVVRSLDEMLAMNASVNMYMFHGGTNFGFDNGANLDSVYQPCPTTYDYDAPLTEAGDPTEKYFAIKNVIRKYAPVPDDDPVAKPKLALGNILLRKKLDLETTVGVLENLMKVHKSTNPMSFEDVDQPYGLVAYETTISFRPFSPSLLKVPGLKDRGYVYVDYELRGILSREAGIYEMPLKIRQNQTLTILVENQGRVNFGDGILDPKGIVKPVQLGSRTLMNWRNIPLPEQSGGSYGFSTLEMFAHDVQAGFSKHFTSSRDLTGFGVYEGSFQIPDRNQVLLDTYIHPSGWGKGYLYINGVNLGRYWPDQGPQVTLYVPSPFLKLGRNNITVVELETAPLNRMIVSVDKPVIDGPVPQ